MPTKKQLAANRKNARQSTGPTSPEGKAISSQNALKTGLDAASVVVPFEDADQYNALSNAYYDQYAPTTQHERCLVDMLITSEWLRRRYLKVESGLYGTRFRVDSDMSLSAAYTWDDERMSRIDRRLNSALRSYTHTLKQLEIIHSKKQSHFGEENTLQATERKPVDPKLDSFPISDETAPLTGAQAHEQTPAPLAGVSDLTEMSHSKKQTHFDPKNTPQAAETKPVNPELASPSISREKAALTPEQTLDQAPEQPPAPLGGVNNVTQMPYSKKQTHFDPKSTLQATETKPVNPELGSFFISREIEPHLPPASEAQETPAPRDRKATERSQRRETEPGADIAA